MVMNLNKINKNFYEKLKEITFIPITFTLFNRIDEEYYVRELEIMDKTKYSIDDFEYHLFNFNTKEKFLVKMHNKNFLNNITILNRQLSKEPRIKVFIDYKSGEVFVVKLKNISF